MESNSPFSGTIRAIYANWPAFALSYGAIIMALIVIGVSAQQGWIGFIPLTLALLIILVYFFFAFWFFMHSLSVAE
jgi:hypothetical protein